jgi:hypothetical protein
MRFPLNNVFVFLPPDSEILSLESSFDMLIQREKCFLRWRC